MAATEKISITITKQMKDRLNAKVLSGEYASASEVMRTAFRSWEDENWESRDQIEYMRAKIQEAIDDPRPSIPAEEVFAQIDEMFAADLAKEAAK